MKDKLRVVYDTNVLVSAFMYEQSTPGRLVFQPKQHVVTLTSGSHYGEISEVLRRNTLDKYVALATRELFLTRFLSYAEYIDVSSVITECRDARDNHILELPVDGSADYVVTGDKDLLALDPFRQTRIVPPSEFALIV